ncbi:hypothetical protein RvY_15013 [Ramazzottius varieornatus]|uniref:RING-type E3 ubiquitin transferase n=1 Tax=Ramazzottius varieornatus TaxID=947166 RepID=A0A1D1VY91_RAMVA|nr:hypothetical protein RvY_15013 [Ramazzottius varieornatus]
MLQISPRLRNTLISIGSLILTTAVVSNAFYQRKQFYPSIIYITKSNASMAAIYFQGLTLVFLTWKLLRWVFFGQLRPAEIEHLVDKSWFAMTDTCLAFTVFRDEFNSSFVTLFTILLFLKCFHWLAEDRIDYMERTPVITKLFHFRAVSLLTTLSFLDIFFVAYAYNSLVTRGASYQLVFGFEYAVLCTAVGFTAIKYILHCIDSLHDQTAPWDRKAAILLYTELVINFSRVTLYTVFLVLMFKMQSFPLFAVRPIYMAVKSFKKSLYDVIMSRRAIHTMNTLYPNATLEEIRAGDSTCIICREEMTTSCKKLPCNHIFHAYCLRSWFQRQQTCPTCRLDILRPRRPATAAAPAAAAPAGQPAPGGGAFPPGQFAFPQQPHFHMGNMAFPFPLPPGFPQHFPMPQPGQAGPAQLPNLTGAPMMYPAFYPAGGMMPPPPPLPPMPVPNFADMSEEDLRRLEGDSRRALEMRVAHLRNIQALLDAAVIQFTQYLSLMTPPVVLPAVPLTSTTTIPTGTSEATVSSSSTNATPSEETPTGNSESDEVRRRRLQRFQNGLAAEQP